MPALSIAVQAMPARITVVREEPIRPAMLTISRVVRNAPAKAAKGRTANAAGNRVNRRMTKKPAPALTPMILGLASSLPVTAWRSTPETESPIPASTPSSSRGTRSR